MYDHFQLQNDLEPILRAGDLDTCFERGIEVMNNLPLSPFHIVSDLEFTNSPGSVARYFSDFIVQESPNYRIKAVYTEMMGFYINADRWSFDLFAFDSYGGHDDYDWLSDWQSDDYVDMTLTGMEELQKAYAEYYSENRPEPYRNAKDFADLIVVIKFQQLIKKSAPLIDGLYFPLLATAHDYDFIYEYRER